MLLRWQTISKFGDDSDAAFADYVCRYACFANYTIDNAKYPGKDYDGTIFPPSK